MKKQVVSLVFFAVAIATTPVVAMKDDANFTFSAPKKQRLNNGNDNPNLVNNGRVNNNPNLTNNVRVTHNPSPVNEGPLFSNPASRYTLWPAQLQALRNGGAKINEDGSISYGFGLNNKKYNLTYLSPKELAAYEKQPRGNSKKGWFKLSDDLTNYDGEYLNLKYNIYLTFEPEKASPDGPAIFHCKSSLAILRNQEGGYVIAWSEIFDPNKEHKLLSASLDLYKAIILCHYTVTEIQ